MSRRFMVLDWWRFFAFIDVNDYALQQGLVLVHDGTSLTLQFDGGIVNLTIGAEWSSLRWRKFYFFVLDRYVGEDPTVRIWNATDSISIPIPSAIRRWLDAAMGPQDD